MTLYEILGVAPDADQAAVRAAYRSLAQQHHPDKGGDRAIFQMIQKAYDILSDEDRREHYDTSGETGQPPSLRERAVGLLGQYTKGLFPVLLKNRVDIEQHDPLKLLRAKVTEDLDEAVELQVIITRDITQRTKALKRLVWKQGGESDILSLIIEMQLKELHAQMEKNEREIEVARMALDLLADYDYKVDAEPTARISMWMS